MRTYRYSGISLLFGRALRYMREDGMFSASSSKCLSLCRAAACCCVLFVDVVMKEREGGEERNFHIYSIRYRE